MRPLGFAKPSGVAPATFVGGSAVGSTGASFTPNWAAAGAVAGDLGLIFVFNVSASGTLDPVTNYTPAQGWESDIFAWDQFSYTSAYYQKVLTAGDIAAPALFGGTSTSGFHAIQVYRGAVAAGLRGHIENVATSITHPGFDKDPAHAGVVAVVMDRDPTGAQTPTAGYTQRAQVTGGACRCTIADLLTGYVTDAAVGFTAMTANTRQSLAVFELLSTFNPTATYEAAPSTPVMTSANTPAPNVCSGFTLFPDPKVPWAAFDGVIGAPGGSGAQYNRGDASFDGTDYYALYPYAVSLHEPAKRRVGKFELVPYTASGGYLDPIQWRIEGSNDATAADNGTWCRLLETKAAANGVTVIPKRRWTAFKCWRFYVSVQGGVNATCIWVELKFFKGL